MKMQTICAGSLTLALLCACGAAKDTSSAASIAKSSPQSTQPQTMTAAPAASARNLSQSYDASGVQVSVNYRYGNAKPMNINGQDVLEHKYWSCIDTVTVQFAQPMRVATVLGSTYAQGQYNMKSALTLRSVDSTYRKFTWTTGDVDLCNDYTKMDRITIAGDVWTVGGSKLGADKQATLAYPASVDEIPAGGDQSPNVAQVEAIDTSTSSDTGQTYTCPTQDPTRCFSVSPQRLNYALAMLRQWNSQEASNTALYGDDGLKLMPLDYLMAPYSAPNRTRQYGAPDTLYALRRAARFTQLLFPDLTQIPIADISEADGSTPHSGDTALHPDGAHVNGKDVDWSYITTGSGNDKNAPYHWERNFWFLYALAESTGVDLAITSYKDTFVAMAQDAYNQGLINQHAVGRMSSLLQANFDMNHDKHMHVQVDNLVNNGTSRKFTSSDDVYNCYLGMTTTSQGGEFNYCVPQNQP